MLEYFVIFIVAILLIWSLIWIIGNIFYNLALNLKSNKDKIFKSKYNKIEKVVENEEEIICRKEWLDNCKKEDKYILSFDDLKLHAVEIKNENKSNIYVIICHGYTGSINDMYKYGYQFYKKGYNLLLLDLRGHGKSEGSYIGMGYHDRLDVKKWIEYLIANNGEEIEIVLYGVSMGAATVMFTAGENMLSNVKAVIEDCGYTSIWDEFKYQIKMIYKLPVFPILNFASIVTKIKAGFFLEEGNIIKRLEKSKIPMMFIHGKLDKYVPFEMLDKLYESYNGEKDKLVVENAAHSGSEKILKEKYWERVFLFLEKYI